MLLLRVHQKSCSVLSCYTNKRVNINRKFKLRIFEIFLVIQFIVHVMFKINMYALNLNF